MTTNEDTKFDALRNAIYHASRARFFDFVNRCLSFFVVISGTTAVANLQWFDPRLAAALAAVIGALQLVFDFGRRARSHEILQRRYFDLIAEIESNSAPSEKDIASWQAVLNRIYADEPPPMRALDAIAYNAACDSLGKPNHRLRVGVGYWLFSQVYSFPNTRFSQANG